MHLNGSGVAAPPGRPTLTAEAIAAAYIDFPEVSIADVETAPASDQVFYWDGLVPAGHVTLWSGHGGAGKSTVTTILGICIAGGRPCFGRATKQANVLIFSAEDPVPVVRRRVARICRELDVDPVRLAESFRVIDATDLDPALFVERRLDGVLVGVTTPTFDALRDYVIGYAIGVLIIDNASDVFDADEINRAQVRGFLRSLAQMVRKTGGAVILLSHVDKATSRAGKAAGAEAYSGSTATHNGVRSRVFQLEKEPGVIELQHQKSNLGPKVPAIGILWPEGGIPTLADTPAAKVHAEIDERRALLRLVHEYTGRGEYVSTAVNSTRCAARLFAGEPSFPRHLSSSQATQHLRTAERDGHVKRLTYRTAERKDAERWELTERGFLFIGGAGPLFCEVAS